MIWACISVIVECDVCQRRHEIDGIDDDPEDCEESAADEMERRGWKVTADGDDLHAICPECLAKDTKQSLPKPPVPSISETPLFQETDHAVE